MLRGCVFLKVSITLIRIFLMPLHKLNSLGFGKVFWLAEIPLGGMCSGVLVMDTRQRFGIQIGTSFFFPPHELRPFRSEDVEMVADLINHDTKSWNLEVLRSLFRPSCLVAPILHIRLYQFGL